MNAKDMNITHIEILINDHGSVLASGTLKNNKSNVSLIKLFIFILKIDKL